MFPFKRLGFFMIGTFALIDFAIVIDVFLGLLMDPVDFLLLRGNNFIVFGLDSPHGFIDLIGFAVQMLQQRIRVMGKIGAQRGCG